jgi:methyltransferase (TIGR00027 family)
MEENKASMTAVLTAYARAYHATHDHPKIFDDYLANELFTEAERAYFGKGLASSLAFFDPELAAASPDEATTLAWYMRLQGGPVTLSRSRYTEDCLAAAVRRGVRQYVILGAGLETFVFRQPELMKQLHVFEVDHPATQAYKQNRLAELGWSVPPNLHFVPVDFSSESLAAALHRSAYDPGKAAFCSWLGVTYYLTREAVLDTWRALASLAPAGSAIIFDYLEADAFVPGRAAHRVLKMQEIVRNVGEPMKAGFDPAALAADLAQAGLRLEENLSPADIQARYFSGRTDGYRAFEQMHFARAGVAKPIPCRRSA